MSHLRTVLLVLALAVVAGSAVAEPVLPGPAAMGLYFDAEGMANTITLADPASVDLYLIMKNPGIDAIDGWEVRVSISAGAVITGVELPVGTTAVKNGPSEWTTTMATPLPCSALTKLAIFTVASEATAETLFSLGSVDNPSLASDKPAVHLPGGAWTAVQISSGSPATPCAGINSTTANEPSSWGGVKSLFR